MFLKKRERPRVVRLQNGEVISIADLPKYSTKRWTSGRKYVVVRAVLHGLISQDEALKNYNIDQEEFLSWVRNVAEFGVEGLKSTVKNNRQS